MSEGKEILKKLGRNRSFTDENELLYYFDEYLKECKEQEEIPNLAGFASKCYCSKQTLLDYRVETHPFSAAMKIILVFLEDKTINNKNFTDKFKEFLLTNLNPNDYKKTQEINSTIDAKIESVNNQDLEELKSTIAKLSQSN